MNSVEPIRDLRKVDELKQSVAGNPRNYLLVVFGLNSGLRIGDMLNLKVADVRDKTHVHLKSEKRAR